MQIVVDVPEFESLAVDEAVELAAVVAYQVGGWNNLRLAVAGYTEYSDLVLERFREMIREGALRAPLSREEDAVLRENWTGNTPAPGWFRRTGTTRRHQ